MPKDMTRLLATVSALGLSLGVTFDAVAASPAVPATPTPAASHHLKVNDPDTTAVGRATKIEALSIKQKVEAAADKSGDIKGSVTQKGHEGVSKTVPEPK